MIWNEFQCLYKTTYIVFEHELCYIKCIGWKQIKFICFLLMSKQKSNLHDLEKLLNIFIVNINIIIIVSLYDWYNLIFNISYRFQSSAQSRKCTLKSRNYIAIVLILKGLILLKKENWHWKLYAWQNVLS